VDVLIEESGEFRSAEGRLVAFSRYGPADGRRVVFHYGTPGTRHLSERATNVLAERDVQILVLDRPGYGESSRWPGRCIADVVSDVAMVADLHGWDRFAVWGGSGGGPHALACASLLADRVERCASVVGPAPYGADGLDWMDGMSPGNVEEFDRALEGLAREAVEAVQSGEVPLGPEYELPEADLAALRTRMAEPGYLERTIAMHTGGIDGWIDDAIALVKPWGFDPDEISVPVSVWYGPDDVLCPQAHAEWLLAHVPGAERHELPSGHLLGDAELNAIYGWLVGQ
jgi:pimeloyl-ACP methyl ester carboxylesterase